MKVISSFHIFKLDREHQYGVYLEAEMNAWSEKQERDLHGFRVIGITSFESASGPVIVVAYEWRDPNRDL